MIKIVTKATQAPKVGGSDIRQELAMDVGFPPAVQKQSSTVTIEQQKKIQQEKITITNNSNLSMFAPILGGLPNKPRDLRMTNLATKLKRPTTNMKNSMFLPPPAWFKALCAMNKRSSPFPMSAILPELRGYGQTRSQFRRPKKKLGRKREVIDPNTGKKYSVAHSCVPCHQAKKTCTWQAGCLVCDMCAKRRIVSKCAKRLDARSSRVWASRLEEKTRYGEGAKLVQKHYHDALTGEAILVVVPQSLVAAEMSGNDGKYQN